MRDINYLQQAMQLVCENDLANYLLREALSGKPAGD
jgi:hypothetical protein